MRTHEIIDAFRALPAGATVRWTSSTSAGSAADDRPVFVEGFTGRFDDAVFYVYTPGENDRWDDDEPDSFAFECGYVTGAIEMCLAAWVEEHTGRTDVTFVFDPDLPQPEHWSFDAVAWPLQATPEQVRDHDRRVFEAALAAARTEPALRRSKLRRRSRPRT